MAYVPKFPHFPHISDSHVGETCSTFSWPLGLLLPHRVGQSNGWPSLDSRLDNPCRVRSTKLTSRVPSCLPNQPSKNGFVTHVEECVRVEAHCFMIYESIECSPLWILTVRDMNSWIYFIIGFISSLVRLIPSNWPAQKKVHPLMRSWDT